MAGDTARLLDDVVDARILIAMNQESRNGLKFPANKNALCLERES